MGNCNPKLTPSDPNVRFTKDKKTQEEADENPLIGRYREIFGGIMYLAISTRPDIAQVLNVLARFAENPKIRTHDWCQTLIGLPQRNKYPRICF